MERVGFQYIQLVNDLSISAHGDYQVYRGNTLRAAKSDPEFLAHFIAWNLIKGEIRDSKIAIPIFSLRALNDREYVENTIASLMVLDPVSLVKAYRFNKELSAHGETIEGGKSKHFRSMFQEAIQEYLTVRESNRNWWDRTVLQHRSAMKELYAVSHTVPAVFAQRILFDRDYPRGSVFSKVAKLKGMSAKEAAGTIMNERIPFQTAIGALGLSKEEYQKHPEYALAFMEMMSGQQVLANTKFLKTLGVFDSPLLTSEYNKALERAKKDKRVSTLKASKAASVIEDDGAVQEKLLKKLSAVQEAKIEQTGGIDGDWLILGDISGSMETAIGLSVELSGLISRAVKGKVYLCFFNTSPKLYDITGKTLDEIKTMTRGIRAGGGTACGVGLEYLLGKRIGVNGIVIVSDGGDNSHPQFHDAYSRYVSVMGIMPSVTFLKLDGEYDRMSDYMARSKYSMNTHDLRGKRIDHYSLPNIIKSLKSGKFDLLDEIMNTPLITFEKVFNSSK